MADQADGLLGGVGAGAGDHRHAAGGDLDAQLHHPAVLLVAEGRRLAGGAHRHQPVHPAGDLALHERAERRFVDRAVLERGDERRDSALEQGLSHASNKP